MFDTTAKFVRPEKPQPESVAEQVRQLTQGVNDLIELLRHQQETLRQQGMSLPAGALDGLRRMRQRLDVLNAHAVGGQGELRQLRGLAETTAIITSSIDLTDVLNQVIDRVVQLTGAERGYIVLRNQLTDALEFKIARGLDSGALDENAPFIVSNTIVNHVAHTGEPVLTHNAQNDAAFGGQDSIVGFALRSILAVPLMVRDQVIGVVYCDNRIRAGLFKEHDLNLLTAFANQAAVAIQNARLFEDVRARLAEMTQIRDMMDNIFTSIASGLITLNASDEITAYNAAAEAIIGVPTLDALGKPFSEIVPALNGDFTVALSQARALATREQIELEVEFDTPVYRTWKIKLSPLRDATGMGEGVALVLDDLTELKQREAQLAEAGRYMPVGLEGIRALGGATMAEEREITAVFADVRGFTTFSERQEPETLMQVINQYLSRASDAIELYDGVVDKYIGDAVTGLFNTQLIPLEDHAVAAVRAAMSILYDVAELHTTLPNDQRLFYGIGIHTGMAVLGSMGSDERREFGALGDAPDMSKLLQENAGKGEIMVSEATYERVRQYFDFEPQTPKATKGRTDVTVIYRLIGIRKRTTGLLPQIQP